MFQDRHASGRGFDWVPATQSAPTQTGIVVSTPLTAGGIKLSHAEGIVASTPIVARGNTSARRHVPLRRYAITAVMAALLGLTPAAALAQSPGGPTAPSLVDESQNVDAPAGPNDRRAPRAALLDAAADLQRTGEGQREDGIARALRAIERAQSAFGGSSRGPKLTHLAATTTALVDAQRALQSATVSRQTRRKLDAIALRLDGVGRRMASDLLARATRSDASPRVLLAARASLLRGDRLSADGRHAAAVGAYGQSVKQSGSGIVFDIARFEQNIRSFFDAQTVGYSYSIARNGVVHSARGFGLARTGADTLGGGTPHAGPHREVNIASVTKTITATAMLKLMQKNKTDLDESVEVWLPEQWNLHPSIEDLTFRDLMTQRSGLNESKISTGSTLVELQAAFEKGVDPSDKFFWYQNGNFGVLRVIMAAMLGVDIYGDPDKEPGDVAAETYVTYLQNEVFDQDGTLPDCKPNKNLFGGARTLLYVFPDNGGPGRDTGDWSLQCGGGGLYLSAYELGRFLARLRFTNEILSPLQRKLMRDNFLGYMDPANNGYAWGNGAFGVYYNHGGDLGKDPGDRGADTCVMDYPVAGLQAALLINSREGAYRLLATGPTSLYQCAALAQAFEEAWIATK